ncbi:acyl-coenzyme A amino acid N-acyltransferase 2-like [Ostrea edulis]|uniref:acyl-coenzyme A amino acid N-acyltransferase 2-like n=1 Tax=Ostrea edulis TaxID=37623 RepID=UPI0024AE9307|nr:acyl-coenzyme A amino acid N-acyltransferase 2-like [Ostrea edulis]
MRKLLSNVVAVQRVSCFSTSALHMSEVRISATPQEALVDEKIHIQVDGLPKNGPVTIKASLQEGKLRFSSFGCYTATDQGHVIVENQSSVQGTYTGVEPMGLFWSMKPEPSERENVRLLKKDVTTPIVVTLSVLEGHHSWGSLFDPPPEPLTTLDLYRWYKHKNVRRERVRHGNVRGVLFTPPGPGPFPGVIDMFGSGGGLFDHRAALLASRGFSVLALPFFAYEDLPDNLTEISLDYFIESTEWFAGLPHIKNDGVCVIGLSKSGMYALELCRRVPQVRAAVLVSGVPFYSDAPLKYSGGDIMNAESRFDKVKTTPEGIVLTECYEPTDEYYIRAWESEANVLCITGEDDGCLNVETCDHFMELVPEEHKHRFQLIKYPKAGHLIEPPYSPHCRKSFHKVFGLDFLWGGETKAHSDAQEDSWRRILEFLSNQLKCDNLTNHPLQTESKL